MVPSTPATSAATATPQPQPQPPPQPRPQPQPQPHHSHRHSSNGRSACSYKAHDDFSWRRRCADSTNAISSEGARSGFGVQSIEPLLRREGGMRQRGSIPPLFATESPPTAAWRDGTARLRGPPFSLLLHTGVGIELVRWMGGELGKVCWSMCWALLPKSLPPQSDDIAAAAIAVAASVPLRLLLRHSTAAVGHPSAILALFAYIARNTPV